MSIGRGKLIEDLKFQTLCRCAARTSTVTYYNCSTATSGNAIDTRLHDEIVFILNVGAFDAGGSIDAAVYHATTDNTGLATAVADAGAVAASFGTIGAADDETTLYGSIKCKNFHRWMWLQTVNASATATRYCAEAVMGRGERMPNANAPTFDLNW